MSEVRIPDPVKVAAGAVGPAEVETALVGQEPSVLEGESG